MGYIEKRYWIIAWISLDLFFGRYISENWINIKIVCFFLVIKRVSVKDFGDFLNSCILLFFCQKKDSKNRLYRNGVLGYSLRPYKASQNTLFLTTAELMAKLITEKEKRWTQKNTKKSG